MPDDRPIVNHELTMGNPSEIIINDIKTHKKELDYHQHQLDTLGLEIEFCDCGDLMLEDENCSGQKIWFCRTCERSIIKDKKLKCPACDEEFNLVVMDKLILNRMHRRKEEMIENKEHLSNYSSYAILEELIKIFTDLEIDHQKELSEVSTDA